LRVDVVETEAGLRDLATAWRALAERVPGWLFSQTYDWCLAGWVYLASNATVKCVVVWDGTDLIGIWPFRQTNSWGIRRLDLLGSGLGDYADPLIAPGYDTLDINAQMLEVLSRHGDVLELNFLAVGSNMQAAVEASRFVRKRWRFEDFTIDPRSAESWEAFMGTYSKNFRNHLRSARRKLNEQGHLTFELATEPLAQMNVINWTMQQKRVWLQRNNLKNTWYYAKASRGFVAHLADRAPTTHFMALFSLKLDGVIIASDICAVGTEEITGLITTFDPGYHRFSPGMLIVQDVARWAFDHGLQFGLMVNRALEKERWATRVSHRVAYQLAHTPYGIGFMIPGSMTEIALWLRQHILGKAAKSVFSPSKIKYIRALLGQLNPLGAGR
jgi:CelD/BcsL family acetyltransferase involved in cellulose biosynthesis